MADHQEVARFVVQDLRYILADLAQAIATGSTVAPTLGVVHDGLAWQVRGQFAQAGTGPL
ncbi:hypothetical protein D3C72_2386680 [compost metagenome]